MRVEHVSLPRALGLPSQDCRPQSCGYQRGQQQGHRGVGRELGLGVECETSHEQGHGEAHAAQRGGPHHQPRANIGRERRGPEPHGYAEGHDNSGELAGHARATSTPSPTGEASASVNKETSTASPALAKAKSGITR